MELMDHQLDAVDKLSSGKILWGGVGSGKSATVLAYYMKREAPRHIYIITTAKKRDSLDWEGEAAKFGISTEEHCTVAGIITVDSWNNIKNYTDIEDAFFIFDEQRVVGHGTWVKSFIKIAKKNHWMLLSATPGDTWLDYAPVFIANGFYKNITQFKWEHVVYEPFSRYPKVRGYLNEGKLAMLRNDILVEMPYLRHTERFINWTSCSYDVELLKKVYQARWNPWEDKPVKDAAEMWRLMRRVVNSDPSRLETIRWLMTIHPRLVIWYNFNYELDILRTLADEREVLEWNGHTKNALPKGAKWITKGGKWVYLVQYVAGAEGWNCPHTDAMAFYSLTYSYKNFEQAQGRIDRINTRHVSLFYYPIVSNSIVDRAIKKSLEAKESFNERKFLVSFDKFGDVDGEFLESCQI